jgi:hypothetical protein
VSIEENSNVSEKNANAKYPAACASRGRRCSTNGGALVISTFSKLLIGDCAGASTRTPVGALPF